MKAHVVSSSLPAIPGEVLVRHAVQRWVTRLAGPLWVPAAAGVLRFWGGYRIERLRALRRQFASIRRETNGPLLICANHLTLVDSFIVAWGLAPWWRLVFQSDWLPWNTPEQTNFAVGPASRMLTYLAKCIPVTRGGDRRSVAGVLSRLAYLLSRGDLALLFPEGGRSRTGRVDASSGAWGVGRIVGSLPSCRVLCVYLRGKLQDSWSDYPARGEHFHMAMCSFEPKSDYRGARRSRDIAQQIIGQLASMERDYFDGRQ